MEEEKQTLNETQDEPSLDPQIPELSEEQPVEPVTEDAKETEEVPPQKQWTPEQMQEHFPNSVPKAPVYQQPVVPIQNNPAPQQPVNPVQSNPAPQQPVNPVQNNPAPQQPVNPVQNTPYMQQQGAPTQSNIPPQQPAYNYYTNGYSNMTPPPVPPQMYYQAPKKKTSQTVIWLRICAILIAVLLGYCIISDVVSYIHGNSNNSSDYNTSISDNMPSDDQESEVPFGNSDPSTSSSTPRIGISVVTLTENDEMKQNFADTLEMEEVPDLLYGMWVVSIDEDSYAADAGLEINDVIVCLNGLPTTSMDDVTTVLEQCSVGDTVQASILRYSSDGSYQQYSTNITLVGSNTSEE